MPAPRSPATLPTAALPLRLRLHGVPAILPGDGGPPLPLERKDAGWLALLALDGAMPRDRIAAWLWPAAPAKTAAGSLRQRIFRLRQRLDHRLVEAGERLQLAPGIALDPEGEGDLLAGCRYEDCPEFDAWLRRQREHRRARRIDALTAEAARHEAAGELAAALDRVHALLALEPLSEHAQRRLMRLHYLRGDRAAALAAFERFERLLKDELGSRPAAETLELLATIEGAVAAPAPRRAVVPAALQRPPRLVGRSREQDALARAWGAGRVAWLLGEAGLGKTRLLEAAAAPGAAPALRVAARPGDAAVPYALLARLLHALHERALPAPAALDALDATTRGELARVAPEWGEPAAGPAQGGALPRAVEAGLRASAAAGLETLLLDDLHFADAASLEALGAALAAEPPLPLAWGLAQRPGEGVPALAALRDTLAELQRLHELPLAPLDGPAMAELVAALGLPELDAAALAPALVRHTGGNPLFALETLKDLLLRGAPEGAPGALPQPASVGALIERRLRALSPGALALARAAAVAGPDFDIELAQAVLGRSALELADPWGELESAQVLAGGAFAHDLVADAVQRTLPQPVAAQVHASVAGWLAQRGAEPARLAVHWIAAGRWREGAEAASAASRAARHAGRLAEAIDWHERALDSWRHSGDAAALWQTELDGLETVLAARGPAEAAERARAAAERAPSPGERSRALTRAAYALLFQARWAESLRLSEEALALGQAEGGFDWRLEVERAYGMGLAQTGRAPEAVARLDALRAEVDARGSLRQRFEHRSALAYALNLASRPQATAAALRETLALAEAAGDDAERMSTLSNLAAVESATGRLAAAVPLQRQALALLARTGAADGPHARVAELNLGLLTLHTGAFGEALALLERGPERAAPVGPMWVANAHNHLAALWTVLGQPHRAEAALAAAPEVDAPAVTRRRVILGARLARLRGRPDAAALQAALARFGTADVKDTSALRIELARARAADGDTAEALALLGAAEAAASAAGFDGAVLQARLRAFELLLALPAPTPAEAARTAQLRQQIAGRDPAITPLDGHPAEADALLGRAAAAAGDRAAARAHLAAAERWIAGASATLPPALRGAWLAHNPVNAAVAAALRALDASG